MRFNNLIVTKHFVFIWCLTYLSVCCRFVFLASSVYVFCGKLTGHSWVYLLHLSVHCTHTHTHTVLVLTWSGFQSSGWFLRLHTARGWEDVNVCVKLQLLSSSVTVLIRTITWGLCTFFSQLPTYCDTPLQSFSMLKFDHSSIFTHHIFISFWL